MWQIVKRGYSHNPWRVIDRDGLELVFETVEIDHPHLGATVIDVQGYATRGEAITAVLMLAERLYDAESKRQAERWERSQRQICKGAV